MQIRILVVDDHALVREGLIYILSTCKDIDVVDDCGDAEGAHKLSLLTKPDIILMDIKMNRASGIKAARQILNDLPKTKVMFLTIFEDTEFVKQALEAGAAGYVLKHITKDKLIETIKRVYRGERIIDPAVFKQIVEDYIRLTNPCDYNEEKAESTVQNIELTPREQEILYLVIKGMTNKEISVATHLAIDTVKTHLRNIFRKLGVKNRSQATSVGMQILKVDAKYKAL